MKIDWINLHGIKDNNELVGKIKNYYNVNLNKGFYAWQRYSALIDKNKYLLGQISDFPSGCGPVVFYNYVEVDEEPWLETFKYLLDKACTSSDIFSVRYPTAIITHNYYNKKYDGLLDKLRDLGVEIRIYNNIAHGLSSDDRQFFLYADIGKIRKLRAKQKREENKKK